MRDRREDIPLLASRYLERIALGQSRPVPRIDQATMDVLMGYGWPGNVRELNNAMEYAGIVASDGVILPQHLPRELREWCRERVSERQRAGDYSLQDMEKRHISWVLEQCRGKKTRAAELLGIQRATLYRKMEEYGIREVRSEK